jgi:hypothetical protein
MVAKGGTNTGVPLLAMRAKRGDLLYSFSGLCFLLEIFFFSKAPLLKIFFFYSEVNYPPLYGNNGWRKI